MAIITTKAGPIEVDYEDFRYISNQGKSILEENKIK